MKKKITLIEIMVVLAIIAILMSLLLPALGKARKQSQRVVCANNLKQLAIGVHLYSQDYKGYLPVSMHRFNAGAPHVYWREMLNVYINNIPLGTRINGSRHPSIYEGIYVCPVTPEITKNGAAGHGLAWNFRYMGHGPTHPTGNESRESQSLRFITSPKDTVIIADTSDAYNGGFQSRLLYPPSSDNGKSVGDRHLGGLNRLWLDGRVTADNKASAMAGNGTDVDYFYKAYK